MNAVTFMDAMRQPREAAPLRQSSRRRGISPNTALIAGVGTLLLAMGVGVMIGRSGDHPVAAAPATPQIIRVTGAGGETGATSVGGATAGSKGSGAGGSAAGSGRGSAGKKKPAALKKQAETQQGAEEVLKPKAGVKLPSATAHPGEACSAGTAGCENGEFTGNYFGG